MIKSAYYFPHVFVSIDCSGHLIAMAKKCVFSVNDVLVDSQNLLEAITAANNSSKRRSIATPETSGPWMIMLYGCYDIKSQKIRAWDVRVNSSPIPVLLLRNSAHLSLLCAENATLYSDSAGHKRTNGPGAFWLLLAYIDNIDRWDRALAIWQIWRNGRTRGISSRMIYGIYIYLKLLIGNPSYTFLLNGTVLSPKMHVIKYTNEQVLHGLAHILTEHFADYKRSFYTLHVDDSAAAIASITAQNGTTYHQRGTSSRAVGSSADPADIDSANSSSDEDDRSFCGDD